MSMFSDEFKKQLAAESERSSQIVDDAQWAINEALSFIGGLTQDRAVVFESEASKVLLINKQDALMIINDFGMKVEDTEHYCNSGKFVQFQINTNATAYLDLKDGLMFLWSGLGSQHDYGAELSVKTPERLAEILKVLAV